MAKQFCANPKCKKELKDYRMVMMIGPWGFRRYAVCQPCADKLGAGVPSRGGRQGAVKRQKAGA